MGEIVGILLALAIAGAYVALLIGTAVFVLSLGVPGILVWGWFAVFLLGSIVGLVSANS